MISFLAGIGLLIGGYIIYGEFVEKVFHPDDRMTVAYQLKDDVDFVPLKPARAFLIQLLNIAGLGPIFGAISGALWGPVVYLWIVFGTIFAGGVHDYLSGMLSERNQGGSISEVIGIYLGSFMKNVMRVFSVILLEMVGIVFMVGPAGLIDLLTGRSMGIAFWIGLILVYYFLATLLPIDQLIGRIYPFFGTCLIIMAIFIAVGTLINVNIRPMPELWNNFHSMYPENKLPIWPLMFVTVACGAISGFHSTQSPMIARCLEDEHQGRKIFYGAMVAEGIIALIWAAAAIAFFYNRGGAGSGLRSLLLAKGGNSTTVYQMSIGLCGTIGGFLAMLGVVACPITSGDTAFRSARLTIADWFDIDQSKIKNRLYISLPLFIIALLVSFIDYSILWRYFSWANQVLASITLWAGGAYLCKYVGKRYSWIAVAPALFMSSVTFSYFLQSPEGFRLSAFGSNIAGMIFSLICLIFYVFRINYPIDEIKETQNE